MLIEYSMKAQENDLLLHRGRQENIPGCDMEHGTNPIEKLIKDIPTQNSSSY